MQSRSLSTIEKEFIEFISQKKALTFKIAQERYLRTKEQLDFASPEYRKLTDKVHNLFQLVYADGDEEEILDAHKFHDLMHLFRFLSYSFPTKPANQNEKFKSLLASGLKKTTKIFIPSFEKPEIFRPTGLHDFHTTARRLVDNINGKPIVVDYGCGLGYISIAVAELQKSKIFLLDIETLVLEFACFRFKSHAVDFEVIPVRKNDIYPRLPPHNICIVNEVLEHVVDPMRALKNIDNSLEIGGLLYGNFEDHRQEMFHVSAGLGDVRRRINLNFRQIGYRLYRKVRHKK